MRSIIIRKEESINPLIMAFVSGVTLAFAGGLYRNGDFAWVFFLVISIVTFGIGIWDFRKIVKRLKEEIAVLQAYLKHTVNPLNIKDHYSLGEQGINEKEQQVPDQEKDQKK